jgi:hypothetical protein
MKWGVENPMSNYIMEKLTTLEPKLGDYNIVSIVRYTNSKLKQLRALLASTATIHICNHKLI